MDANGQVHFGDRNGQAEAIEKVDIKVNCYTHSTVEYPESTEAVQAPQVTMYSTEWCGYCKNARNYFRANGIPFTELDIEKNPVAKEKYDAINGRGVPVILARKLRMNGFNADGFDRMYFSALNP